MNAIETLISVLCDPEGKCCISGSDDDRRLIDSALASIGAGEVQALSAAPAVHASVKGAMWFTKKPVTIQAIQWAGDNLREVITFTDGPPDTRSHHAGMAWDAYRDLVARDGLKIYTLEGKMLASPGDWIIRGVKGELYPCKSDIFQETYAAASPTPTAEQQAASSAVLKAIREANMQLVRTGDDAFMLVPYKVATAEQAAPKAAPGVGNSGFDHKTAADFLNGKTVSDEAVRTFVATSRWAHDERAALSATLLAMHGVLTSREAEISHLKKALLEAETAPQPAPAPLSEMPYEKRKAIQEGEQIGASDAWFHARHNMLDTLDRRNVFRAGFDRGWNAAIAAQGGK